MSAIHSSGEVLGKLLVALQTLDVLPDVERMAEFLRLALREVPGIADAFVCMHGKILPAGDAAIATLGLYCPNEGDLSVSAPICSLRDRPDIQLVTMRSPRRAFGCLQLVVDDEAQFRQYKPFVINIGHMFATILENRDNAQSWFEANGQLNQLVDELDHRVNERTKELVSSQRRFKALIQDSGELFGVCDADGTITFLEGPVSAYFGVEADALIATNVLELIWAADQERARAMLAQRLKTTAPMPPEDFWIRRPDGTWLCLNVLVSNLLDDPAVGGIVLTARDVTQSKHREEARRVVSGANAALVHASNEDDLFNEICKLVVSDATYCLAWIGLADVSQHLGVRVVTFAEHFAGTFEALQRLVGNDAYRGPVVAALETRELQIVQDVEALPETTPWRRLALSCGYRSMIALPVDFGGDDFGVLVIYAEESDAFSAESVVVLAELAGDLGYGATALRTG